MKLPGALGYMPRDAFAVALAPTDFDGEQLRRLEHLLGPSLRATSLRDGVTTVPLGRATGDLEASPDGIEGRLRIEVPGGLD